MYDLQALTQTAMNGATQAVATLADRFEQYYSTRISILASIWSYIMTLFGYRRSGDVWRVC